MGAVNGKNRYEKYNQPTAPNFEMVWSIANARWELNSNGTTYYTNGDDTSEPPCEGWVVVQTGFTPINVRGRCIPKLEISGPALVALTGDFFGEGTKNGKTQYTNAQGASLEWSTTDGAWILTFGGTTYYLNATDTPIPPCQGLGIWKDLFVLGNISLAGPCSQFQVSKVELSGVGNAIDGIYARELTGNYNGKPSYIHETLNFFSTYAYIRWDGAQWEIVLDGLFASVYYTSPSPSQDPPCVGWTTTFPTIGQNPSLAGACFAVSVAPVELLAFEAKAGLAGIALTWATATETQNAGFEVLKSTDGNTWESMAYVKGAGDTRERQIYRLTDRFPFPGKNHYRLIQEDLDGARRVVAQADAWGSSEGQLEVYPQPAASRLQVRLPELPLPSANMQVKIRNSLSSTVWEETRNMDRTHFSIDVGKFPPGMYLLEIRTSKQVYIRRFYRAD